MDFQASLNNDFKNNFINSELQEINFSDGNFANENDSSWGTAFKNYGQTLYAYYGVDGLIRKTTREINQIIDEELTSQSEKIDGANPEELKLMYATCLRMLKNILTHDKVVLSFAQNRFMSGKSIDSFVHLHDKAQKKLTDHMAKISVKMPQTLTSLGPSSKAIMDLCNHFLANIADADSEFLKEGLFRISAKKSEVDSLIEKIETGEDVAIEEIKDSHLIIAVIKSLIRGRDGIIHAEMKNRLLEINLKDSTALRQAREIFRSLNDNGRVILDRLFKTADKVDENKDITKMPFDNIGRVLSQVIFQADPANEEENLSAIAKKVDQLNQLTTWLLQNHKKILLENENNAPIG